MSWYVVVRCDAVYETSGAAPQTRCDNEVRVNANGNRSAYVSEVRAAAKAKGWRFPRKAGAVCPRHPK